MTKVNLRFVFDILDSHIGGLERDYHQKQLSQIEYEAKVEALEDVKTALKLFIGEANKL